VAFVVASALLSLLIWRSFGGSLPLQPQAYRVALPLPAGSNLVDGSDVQIAGVKVGRVAAIRRRGNAALATLQLQSQYVPLRAQAMAIVRTKTLLGEGYVEIAPGPPTAPTIPDGGRLDARRVRPTVQLDQFLETFTPDARRSMRRLFAGMSTAFGGRGESLNGALGHSAPFAASLGDVLRTLDGQRADLQRLFARSGDVLNALGERPGVLRAAITAGSRVLDTTGQRNRELAATVRALPSFLRQLRATSQTITAASGDVNRAVTALLPVAPRVRPTLAELNAALPEFRGLFRELPATIAAGDRGLPSLTPILRAIPPAFRELYAASREATPLMQLSADYRDSAIVGALADAASMLNGKMVGPGGKIVTRAGGGTYLSNESIAGWTKRLPTDRSNPYPKPGGLDVFARQGFLNSYDCRNLHNREYLPPTGSGVPPCVEQGPWEYQGTRAYYPRLTLAPP
jgi:virulence factor Mce-like protein